MMTGFRSCRSDIIFSCIELPLQSDVFPHLLCVVQRRARQRLPDADRQVVEEAATPAQ